MLGSVEAHANPEPWVDMFCLPVFLCGSASLAGRACDCPEFTVVAVASVSLRQRLSIFSPIPCLGTGPAEAGAALNLMPLISQGASLDSSTFRLAEAATTTSTPCTFVLLLSSHWRGLLSGQGPSSVVSSFEEATLYFLS